jgi:hypothetical protein
VLNSNAQVTSITLDIAEWLATEFMSALEAIGTERLDWVVAPSLRGRNGALETVSRLPTMHFDLFDDMEGAVA